MSRFSRYYAQDLEMWTGIADFTLFLVTANQGADFINKIVQCPWLVAEFVAFCTKACFQERAFFLYNSCSGWDAWLHPKAVAAGSWWDTGIGTALGAYQGKHTKTSALQKYGQDGGERMNLGVILSQTG